LKLLFKLLNNQINFLELLESMNFNTKVIESQDKLILYLKNIINNYIMNRNKLSMLLLISLENTKVDFFNNINLYVPNLLSIFFIIF